MGEQATTPFIPRELWTAQELAAYLGKPIKFVYRLTHERRIEHYVVGKELRFDPEHVAAFLGEAHYGAGDDQLDTAMAEVRAKNRTRRGRPRGAHDIRGAAS